MVLLLIAGIPVMVVLIATWLWYYVVQGDLDLVAILGTSNNGDLVQPPRQLVGDTGEPGDLSTSYGQMEPKWTFLILGGPQCDEVCENTLYTTRQIRIAMGKDFNRIRRIYLGESEPAQTTLTFGELRDSRPAPATFNEFLASEHATIKVLTMAADHYGALFSEYQNDPSTWYLVDPAGWIMMSYDSGVDYKGVMSDLKFLLKNSSE